MDIRSKKCGSKRKVACFQCQRRLGAPMQVFGLSSSRWTISQHQWFKNDSKNVQKDQDPRIFICLWSSDNSRIVCLFFVELIIFSLSTSLKQNNAFISKKKILFRKYVCCHIILKVLVLMDFCCSCTFEGQMEVIKSNWYK